ncbi:uncharacterized protein BDR25DRAFT_349425 [Lindgomyces ingoldianus]|uniref:Uncharacterized protein n=1 Tax=Lindgomyces ingoldianus TaxID=673940 RepID=A0ACB6RDC7_9PLEO|nr:uncharacterized protein BDR25DRAFT_349425 [Lindgomyces ingoldianus]KAF2476332.1 hypothetical protein BDR25DRAFT_349425 [Lindgomyces ingoldianus]
MPRHFTDHLPRQLQFPGYKERLLQVVPLVGIIIALQSLILILITHLFSADTAIQSATVSYLPLLRDWAEKLWSSAGSCIQVGLSPCQAWLLGETTDWKYGYCSLTPDNDTFMMLALIAHNGRRGNVFTEGTFRQTYLIYYAPSYSISVLTLLSPTMHSLISIPVIYWTPTSVSLNRRFQKSKRKNKLQGRETWANRYSPVAYSNEALLVQYVALWAVFHFTITSPLFCDPYTNFKAVN